MLDKLIDLFIQFIELFQVYVFVDQTDEAVVLRAGKYKRTVGPGFHWVWPLNIEDLIDVNVKPTPYYTSNQSLHTEDEYLVNVQVGYSLAVTTPRTYLLEFEETAEAVTLGVEGYVADAISKHSFRDVHNGVWLQGVKTKSMRYANVRGAKLTGLVVIDLANGDANKLWVEGVELS